MDRATFCKTFPYAFYPSRFCCYWLLRVRFLLCRTFRLENAANLV